MTCADCGLTWDMNDPEPPSCAPKDKRSPLTEAFDSIFTDNDPRGAKNTDATDSFNSEVDTETPVLESNAPMTHSVPVSRVLLPVADSLNWKNSKNLANGLYISGLYMVSLIRCKETPICSVEKFTYFASDGKPVKEIKVATTVVSGNEVRMMCVRTFDSKTNEWSNYSKVQTI
jgi:hypothetical protein